MKRKIQMKNKARWLTAVLLALLLLLGLNACGTARDLSPEETNGGIEGVGIKKTEAEPPSEENSVTEAPSKENFRKTDSELTGEDQLFTTEGQVALERLWSRMESRPKALLAASCLGSPAWRDPAPLRAYFRENFSQMVEELPFLLEIPEDRILGEGELLYCVVPRNGSTSLAVNRVSWSYSGNSESLGLPEPQVEEVLYRSENAQPLLVFVDYGFMDNSHRRRPDIEISVVAGNGGSVVWYPECYPESFLINAPIDEDYDPLILELEDLTDNGLNNWGNGDEYWAAPTELELIDTNWYCGGSWYMSLSGHDDSAPYYAGLVDIYQMPADGTEYSGVWKMDDECLYLQIIDGVGNVTKGRYPVALSPSAEELYIWEDPKSGIKPVFFGEEDIAAMYLTLVYN